MYIINGGKIWGRDGFAENDRLVVKSSNQLLCSVDLDKDDRIIPGVIDFHSHLWSPSSISPFGVDDNRLLTRGVIAAQEPGSFGCHNWMAAGEYWKNCSKLYVKAFMHLLPDGLSRFPVTEAPRPEDISLDEVIKAAECAKKTGRLQGIKIHLGWLPYQDAASDEALLECARTVADAVGTHIMVHISNQYVPVEKTMSYMKKGDVVTHIFSAKGHTILDENDKVYPGVFEAHERGVLFDVGASGKHFSWNVFRKAYAQGLCFDTLGTDITMTSWNNRIEKNAYVLFYLMSAMLNYGVPEETVFRAVLDTPAAYLNFRPDYEKSVLVLKKVSADEDYAEGSGDFEHCSFLYRPMLFVYEGNALIENGI